MGEKLGTWALDINGGISWCTAPPEKRGMRRCNHVAHQMEGENNQDFCERISALQERINEGLPVDEIEELSEKVAEAIYGPQDDSFIPYEGTKIETKPYRMSEEERECLTKIENKMQLDMNIDGGYMELEEPLWNDMDKNYYSMLSGMNKRALNSVLRGEAYIITESKSRIYRKGRLVHKDDIDKWKKEGYPKNWDPDAKIETGVVAMNKWAKQEHNFEATKYVYVLPYYMRMGVADHTYSNSASEDSVEREIGDAIESELTSAYKYLLRKHSNPDAQQNAYEALLNNDALPEDLARWDRGYRKRSLAKEFAGKGGVFREVLSASSIPYSGRAKIVPNADLKFGDIGIPASMAIDIFRPTIVHSLMKEGYNDQQIYDYMRSFRLPQNQIPIKAKQDLERRIAGKRVAMNRQPSLHQPSFQSFRPKISSGAAAEIHPLYCKAYNADFDGDDASFYAFNSDFIIPTVDRSIDANLDVNTRLSRHHDTLNIMPTRDSLFGLLSILNARSDK